MKKLDWNIYEEKHFEDAIKDQVKLKLGNEEFSGTLSELKQKALQLNEQINKDLQVKTESKLSRQELNSQTEIIKGEFFAKLKLLYGKGYSDDFYRNRAYHIIHNKEEEITRNFAGKEVKTKGLSFMSNTPLETITSKGDTKIDKKNEQKNLGEAKEQELYKKLDDINKRLHEVKNILEANTDFFSIMSDAEEESMMKDLEFASNAINKLPHHELKNSKNLNRYKQILNRYKDIVSGIGLYVKIPKLIKKLKITKIEDILKPTTEGEFNPFSGIDDIKYSIETNANGNSETKLYVVDSKDYSSQLNQIQTTIQMHYDQGSNQDADKAAGQRINQMVQTFLQDIMNDEELPEEERKNQLIRLICIITGRTQAYKYYSTGGHPVYKAGDENIFEWVQFDPIANNSIRNIDFKLVDDIMNSMMDRYKITEGIQNTFLDKLPKLELKHSVQELKNMFVTEVEDENGACIPAGYVELNNINDLSKCTYNQRILLETLDKAYDDQGGTSTDSTGKAYMKYKNEGDELMKKQKELITKAESLDQNSSEFSTIQAEFDTLQSQISSINGNFTKQQDAMSEIEKGVKDKYREHIEEFLHNDTRSLGYGKRAKDFTFLNSPYDKAIFNLHQAIKGSGGISQETLISSYEIGKGILEFGSVIASMFIPGPGWANAARGIRVLRGIRLGRYAQMGLRGAITGTAARTIFGEDKAYMDFGDFALDRGSEFFTNGVTGAFGGVLGSYNKIFRANGNRAKTLISNKTAFATFLGLTATDVSVGVATERARLNYLLKEEAPLGQMFSNPMVFMGALLGLSGMKKISAGEYDNLMKNLARIKDYSNAHPEFANQKVTVHIEGKPFTTTVDKLIKNFTLGKGITEGNYEKYKGITEKRTWNTENTGARKTDIVNDFLISKNSSIDDNDARISEANRQLEEVGLLSKGTKLTEGQEQGIIDIHNLSSIGLEEIQALYNNKLYQTQIKGAGGKITSETTEELNTAGMKKLAEIIANDKKLVGEGSRVSKPEVGTHEDRQLNIKKRALEDYGKLSADQAWYCVKSGLTGGQRNGGKKNINSGDPGKNNSEHGTAAIDESFKKVAILKGKFTKIGSLVDIINNKKDIKKANINIINDKIEQGKKVIKDLEYEQAILSSEIPNLNLKIDEKSRKQEGLKRNREELNRSMAQNQRTLVTMTNNKTGIDTPEITQQKELIRKSSDDITSYDRQIKQMDLEIEDLTSKLEKSRTKKGALDAEVKQKKEDFQNDINNVRMNLLQEYEEQINNILNSIKSTSKIDIRNFDSDLEELSIKDLQSSIQVIESNFGTGVGTNTGEIGKIGDEIFPLFSSDLNDSNRNTPNTTARFNTIKSKIEAARSDYDKHIAKLQSILGKKKTSETKIIDAESEFSSWETEYNRIYGELTTGNTIDPKEIEELERRFKALESDHKSELKNIKLKEKDPEVIIGGRSYRPSKFLEDLEVKRKNMESIKDMKKRTTLEKLIDNDTAGGKGIEQDIVDFNTKVDNPNDETFHQGKIKELEKKIDDLQSTVNSQGAMELRRSSGETYEKYLANCKDKLKKIKDKWELKTYDKYKQAMDEYEVLKKAAGDTVDGDEKRLLNEKMDEVRNRKKIYEDANAQYLDKKGELNTQFNKIEPKHNDFIGGKLSRGDLVDNAPDVLSTFVNDFHLNATLSTAEGFDQHILSKLYSMDRDKILESFADVHAMEILLRSGYFDTPRGKFSPEQRNVILARNERIKQILFTRLNTSIIKEINNKFVLKSSARQQLGKYFYRDFGDGASIYFLSGNYPKLKKKYTSAGINELTSFADKIDSGYMTALLGGGVDFNVIRRKMSEEAKENATTWHNENSGIGSKDGGKDAQGVTVDVRSRSNKAVERLMNGGMVRKVFGQLFKWFIESEKIQTGVVVSYRVITGDYLSAMLDRAILNPLTNKAAGPLTRWVIFGLAHYGAPTLLEWIKEEWQEGDKIESLNQETKTMLDTLKTNPEYATETEKITSLLIDDILANDNEALSDLTNLYKKHLLADITPSIEPEEMRKYFEGKEDKILPTINMEDCKDLEKVKNLIYEYEYNLQKNNPSKYIESPFSNIRMNSWIIDYLRKDPRVKEAAKEGCKEYRNENPGATLEELKEDEKWIGERLSDAEINATGGGNIVPLSINGITPESDDISNIPDIVKQKLKSNFEKIGIKVTWKHPDGNTYTYDGINYRIE